MKYIIKLRLNNAALLYNINIKKKDERIMLKKN